MPHHAKQAAQQVWQLATGQKQKMSGRKDSDVEQETKCPKTWEIKGEIEINICQEGKQSKDTKGVKDMYRKFLSPIMEDSKDDTTAAPKSKSKPKDTKAITNSESDGKFPGPPPRKTLGGTYANRAKPKIKAALKSSSHRIEEEGSSSNEEHKLHRGGSPHHSLEGDLDDGKLMDVNEDDDLNGKDTASLQEILKSESDSDLNKKAVDNKMKLKPVEHKPLGNLPPQGRPVQALKPKRYCQEAYNYEKLDWWETAGKSLKDPKKLLIKSEPAHGETSPNISNMWPEPEANIIYPVAGEIKLKDQHPKLQSALWGGMQEMQWFYTVAKLEKADTIRRQVKEDISFILACSTIFRSDIKDASSKGITACYNLTGNKTEKFAKHITDWLKDDSYIFPLVKWDTSSPSSSTSSEGTLQTTTLDWVDAVAGRRNHRVRYISKEHPANPTNQDIQIIVTPRGKALTNPKLVCIHNDRWKEVHWDSGRYTVGAAVPQLHDYDTEGSEADELLDEELEEPEAVSDTESDEAVKEIDDAFNKIKITPVEEAPTFPIRTLTSLQGLPTDTLPAGLRIPSLAQAMSTQTTTATAVTTQPSTTPSAPQHIQNVLRQVLKRSGPPGGSGGGPGGPGGGPGGPPGPDPNAPQVPVAAAANVKTMGALPQVFTGDRSKADDFIKEVKGYLRLNADVAGYNSPFKKIAFTLTLIKGESTAQWVRDMGEWIDRLHMPQDNIPALWDQFLLEFSQRFQDTQAAQRA
ncbi:hypothetical protein BJV74DRAFT_888900 [Russula compacta]|nr:hypothetical protein BJV74DRAFT_888900 [Russula compacta]